MFSFGTLVVLGCLFDVEWYYQGLENFLVVFLSTILPKIFQLLLTIMLIKTKNDFYLYVFLSYLAIFVHAFIPFVPAAFKCRCPGRLNISEHIKPTIQMFASAALVSIYTAMDRSMIKWITLDEREVGYYEQAFKVFSISSALVTVVAQVLSPRVARIKDEGITSLQPVFENGFRASFLFSFPMFVGVFVLAPMIVNGLFGPGYEQSIPILRVFSVLPVIVGVGRLIVYIYINPFFKQKFSVYATIIGASTNMVLNTLLCFFGGAFGAAVATLVSEIVVALLNLLFFRRVYGASKYLNLIWKYLVASLLMGTVTYIMGLLFSTSNELLSLIVIIPTSAVLYFIALLVFKEKIVTNACDRLFDFFKIKLFNNK